MYTENNSVLKLVTEWNENQNVSWLSSLFSVSSQLLPTPVDPLEAEEMFNFADKDRDSR